jgi:hypothetical protein
VADSEEIVNEYDDFYRRIFTPLVVPILRELNPRDGAPHEAELGAVSAALRDRSRPRMRAQSAYLWLASDAAAERLATRGLVAPDDPVTCVRAFSDGRFSR